MQGTGEAAGPGSISAGAAAQEAEHGEAAMDQGNRQIVLTEIPQGKLRRDHFALVETARPEPADGEVLLRTLYMSLDAANRAWMQGATYRSALKALDVMAGGALAEVVESKAAGFSAGDLVFTDTGWQEYAALPARHLEKLPRTDPITHLLSVYGVTGLTAYFGLLECGRPKPGETVVVSAAAGAVGSIVGQIAKLKGCRVVGIAGGAEKCSYIVAELGFDAAIDYKSEDVAAALAEKCPDGIDIYFDNVGGEILDAALTRLARGARVIICGAISQYNATGELKGPSNYLSLLVNSATMTGFVVSNYYSRYGEAAAEMAGWLSSGKLLSREDIVTGIENFPAALLRLFSGENNGKQVLQIAAD